MRVGDPRILALAVLPALLAGCGGAGNGQQAAPTPANGSAPTAPAPTPVPATKEAVADPVQSDAGLAAMSPGQRRAYDRGLADCRAGRYRPANYPEAYRIGCAAAHDR